MTMNHRDRYQKEMNGRAWWPGRFIAENGIVYWWEQLASAENYAPAEAMVARNTMYMTTQVIRQVMAMLPRTL